jgi:hypothetical protein
VQKFRRDIKNGKRKNAWANIDWEVLSLQYYCHQGGIDKALRVMQTKRSYF